MRRWMKVSATVAGGCGDHGGYWRGRIVDAQYEFAP
jgi:hypothetical protein